MNELRDKLLSFAYCELGNTDPQPGDLAYFDQPYQHHAMVQRVDGDSLYLIQGNYGVPGRVAESVVSIAKKKPIFYSIETLIQAKLEEVNNGT